ncbi:hypothetical protein KIJ05_07755 [Leuconostoc gelidum subsp. gasicomitatum]|uniref:hypothetical protein n=1 Tax=Leuconostoc gasicomitatum TaxID=115778 RepID=UPI001CC3DE76|nr:hypothetical protein [Leuconostoc gasicomitatum]MBZ5985011.1 hypothetical protein [Leuconostoc gasicomitatum]
MKFKQNHFRKVPEKLLFSLSQIVSDKVIISTNISISARDITNGKYKKWNINSINDLNDESVINFMPSKREGPSSKINLVGRTTILRDLPKEDKSWNITGPNFGDYSKGTHTSTITKPVFQKEYELPREIHLSIKNIGKEKDSDEIQLKIWIQELLSKSDKLFSDDFLFNLNLLQESTGNCGVISLSQEENDKLIEEKQKGWEFLPIGTGDIRGKILQKIGNKKDISDSSQERIDYFTNPPFEIVGHINGINSFERYIGLELPDGVIILENFNYGNAIYVLKSNWETFSKMTRGELIKQKSSETERVTHNKNWKINLETVLGINHK